MMIFCLGINIFTGNAQEIKQDSVFQPEIKNQSFDPMDATEKYLQTLTAEQKDKSDAYFEGGYWLSLWNFIVGMAVAWIFLTMGLSRWIKNKIERFKNRLIQHFLYLLMYFLIVYLITFPFELYQGFYREHSYGLSNLSLGGWIIEETKGLILLLFFGGIFITFLYWIIKKVGKTWWIWGSFVMVLFLIFSMFISPVFISPLFNEYKPLENETIKEEILSMARANGVPAENVYQFDASKQSNRISANVSGFGSTTRISLNDNLLNNCTSGEIKAVMAHELGHYILNHTYEMLIYFALVIFAGMAFVNWAFNKLVLRYKSKWAISGINDIVGFPLIIFLFSAYFFVASPVLNNIIRSNEIEADIFGLNAAREPDGFASVAMKLSTYRKINPSKLEEIIFFDHPSGKTRISNAMQWKAEHWDNK